MLTSPATSRDFPPMEATYRFSGWRAEPSRNRLQRRGHETRLTPRSMEVLVYLLNSGRRVVSKDELLREVWQGSAVTDDALVVTVYELRKALGDKARQPRYLETVPRRGYRFMPPVEVEPPTESAPHLASPQPVAPRRPPQGPRQGPPSGRGLLLAVAGLAVVTGTVIALGGLQSPEVSVGATAGVPAGGELGSAAPAAGDPVVEALLVEGRRRLTRRTREDLDRAEEAFRRVLERGAAGPELAHVEAGLARVAATRADLRLGDRFELYHEARLRAEKALELAPDLADAHLALGTTRLLVDWDLRLAAESLDRALVLASGDPDAHQVLAWSRSARGDHAGAEAAARRAIELDPESASRRADLAFILLIGGRVEQALAEAEAALVLESSEASALMVLVRAHLGRGEEDAAREVLLRLFPPGTGTGTGTAAIGDLDFPRLLEALLARIPTELALTFRAHADARAGRTDQALGFLDRAFARRDWEILWLEHLPELEPLRQEERFQDLLRRRDARQAS